MTEYIDRHTVMEHLFDKCISKYPASFAAGLYAAANEIRNLAAADVAPVVYAAEIPSGKYGTIDPLVQTECSACGCGHGKGVIYGGDFNYCPNCGARLDLGRVPDLMPAEP